MPATAEVVIEATGNPMAGIAHALAAIEAGKHIVMVNVEADALCGWWLADKARERGVVYSMAYGDQPALVAEMVDWARSAGFTVAAAGKGTKYLPFYHTVTPDDVWTHYGLTAAEAKAAGMNPQMFNSFLDGTKSAIEMAAIANACGLDVPSDGLAFPPCGVDDLAQVLRPRALGGVLERDGMVEVVSSLERDGRPVFRDLRWGVYVVLRAPNDYAAACFKQYGLPTDPTGRYAAMYKPFHLIGLELSISVLNAALRGEATGCDAGVARRCCDRRQARAQGRRDARWRGRLHGLWQARSGAAQPRRACAAARPCPQGAAHERYRGRHDGALERCCDRRERTRGAGAPRGRSDGAGAGRVIRPRPSAPPRVRLPVWVRDTGTAQGARTAAP